jgi:hypothetical protein
MSWEGAAKGGLEWRVCRRKTTQGSSNGFDVYGIMYRTPSSKRL